MSNPASIKPDYETAIAIFQSQYLPSVSYFVSLQQFSKIIIDGNEKFVKSTTRNRCTIINANGPLVLSIPLKGGRGVKLQMKDVRIAYDEPWQKIHWRSIAASYGKSSYFLFYENDFRIFYEKKFEFLIDFNTALLEVCLKTLKMGSKVFIERNISNDNFFQVVQNSKLKTQNTKPYHQVFQERHGFIADPSIIDLIFNLGNEAGIYIRKESQKKN